MPSEVLHQRSLFSLGLPPTPLSLFSEEFCFPTEKPAEFWRTEFVPDHCGTRSKSIASSLLEKNRPMEGNYVAGLEPPRPYLLKDPNTTIGLDNHLIEAEETASRSMSSWRTADQDFRSRSNAYVQHASLCVEGKKLDSNGFHYENSLFSSSLSDTFDKRLKLPSDGVYFSQSVNTNSNVDEDKSFEFSKEIEAETIGYLLPDDDDLLSGVINDFENIARPGSDDDIEDDLFYSGGGMELETDDSSKCKGRGPFFNCQLGVSNGLFASKHQYGGGPSRTLFVRNIDSSLEDADLRVLFEQYGDVHMLNTTCKHCGFIIVSYYDIRAAQNARRALQNRSLRHQKLDIRFSFPKDNSSEKDANLGIVVFNLDSSVSNSDIHLTFGIYGEIKEIREIPHKRHHKIIEFFDIRAAEAALLALNRSDIAGKRIKLVPNRLEGARQCFMQQLCQEMEQDNSGYRPGSPPDKLASECYGSIPLMANASNGLDNGGIEGLHSAVQVLITPYMDSGFPELSSGLHGLSSSVGIASSGIHSNQSGPGELSHTLGQMNFSSQCMPTVPPHSLPEYNSGVATGIPYNSSSTIPTMMIDFNIRPAGGINNGHMHNGLGGIINHTFEPKSGFGVRGNGSSCYGHQFAWNNASDHSPGSMIWANSPSFLSSIPARPPPEMHGLPRAPSHMLSAVLPPNQQHPVGSAPTVNLSLWDTRHGCRGDSMEIPAFHHGSLGSMGFSGSSPLHQQELNRNMYPHAGGSCMDPSISSAHVGIPSPHQRRHTFHARTPTFPVASSYDTPNDRIRSRRSDQGSNQSDNKKLFELDIDRILRREDSRTTLMIKNIPNKYTSKMLLATIDEHHRGTYDFIYLPIDFKNKCNVGYAFINMTKPENIIPFYQTLNGKKWEKFNSEKVATLAYARIQGRAALIAHFQNSSLMNEDKRCRPILFHSEGPNAGDQEPFPVGVNIQSRPGKSRAACNEESHGVSPSNSANGDDSSNASDSSSGSTNVSQ